MRKSTVFLVSECGDIELIPHEQYVEVVRRQRPLRQYRNQHAHVADWYVGRASDHAFAVEDESYSLLEFDENGFVVWPSDKRAHSMEDLTLQNQAADWMPTPEQRGHMLAMIQSSDAGTE